MPLGVGRTGRVLDASDPDGDEFTESITSTADSINPSSCVGADAMFKGKDLVGDVCVALENAFAWREVGIDGIDKDETKCPVRTRHKGMLYRIRSMMTVGSSRGNENESNLFWWCPKKIRSKGTY